MEASRNNLPTLYRERFFQPYLNKLDQISEQGFNSILIARSDQTQLMLDIAQAILQRGEGYNWASTNAFKELVSDLYDGFLSAEDRRGIERPDKDIMPPLVKWGDPSSRIYTWPLDDETIEGFDVRAAGLYPMAMEISELNKYFGDIVEINDARLRTQCTMECEFCDCTRGIRLPGKSLIKELDKVVEFKNGTYRYR